MLSPPTPTLNTSGQDDGWLRPALNAEIRAIMCYCLRSLSHRKPRLARASSYFLLNDWGVYRRRLVPQRAAIGLWARARLVGSDKERRALNVPQMILSTTFPALVPLRSHAVQAGGTDFESAGFQLRGRTHKRVAGRGAFAFVLTRGVLLHLPKRPQQLQVAFVAFVVLRVEQDLLGVDEQARDAETEERHSQMEKKRNKMCLILFGVGGSGGGVGGGESHSHWIVEVPHQPWTLAWGGIAEARVVGVADDALYPGQRPRGGHGLVGEMTCRRVQHVMVTDSEQQSFWKYYSQDSVEWPRFWKRFRFRYIFINYWKKRNTSHTHKKKLFSNATLCVLHLEKKQ